MKRADGSSIILVMACIALGCGPLGEMSVEWEPPVADSNSEPVGDTQHMKPQKPTIDPGLPLRQCEREFAITGSGASGMTVIATGIGGNATTEIDALDGSFCIAVQLAEESTNIILVRVMDSEGRLSDPVTVSVSHETCSTSGDVEMETVPPKNTAVGGSVTSSDPPTEGNLDQLIDGDGDSWARWIGMSWCYACEYGGWVSLELVELTAVGKISIQWRDMLGTGHYYASKYRVLISNLAEPKEPSLTSGYWQEISTVVEGNGGLDLHYLDGRLVRHVALLLELDGRPGWTPHWPQQNFEEYFAISEIEVWTQGSENVKRPQGQLDDVCGR